MVSGVFYRKGGEVISRNLIGVIIATITLLAGINGVPPNEVVSVINTSPTHVTAQINVESTQEWRTFNASAYVALCDTGCSGFTRTEIDVRHTNHYEGYRVVAVDPSVIPLWSTLEIRLADGYTFYAIAIDTGGAIKGRKIDVLMPRLKDARDFGRQDVSVRLLSR